MQHYLDALVLHFLQVKHKEWKQVIWEEQFSWVVRPCEIVLVIVGNLHFHVLFEVMWEPFLHVFKNVVDLHQVATIGAKHFIGAEVTVHVNQIGLQHVDLLTLHDNLCVHLVLVSLECFILCLLLTKLPPLFLSDNFLLLSFNFVLLSLLNCIVFCLNRLLVVFLRILDAINDDGLGAISDCLVFLEEVKNFAHEPWDDLLVHCALSGWY